MIGYISGKLTYRSPQYIIIDVNGLGFQIFIPLSTYYKLPQINEEVKLFTYLHVKENGMVLFGFYSREEQGIFEMLLSVGGVGPKIAINILSELSIPEFKGAIRNENLKTITSVSGVGKKIGQRILLELNDKIGKLSEEEIRIFGKRELFDDAVSALVTLGYNKNSSENAVNKILKETSGEINLESIIKQALKHLR